MPVFSAKRTDEQAPAGARWWKQTCDGCGGEAPFAHKPAAGGPSTAWCHYDKKEADQFMCKVTGKRDERDHRIRRRHRSIERGVSMDATSYSERMRPTYEACDAKFVRTMKALGYVHDPIDGKPKLRDFLHSASQPLHMSRSGARWQYPCLRSRTRSSLILGDFRAGAVRPAGADVR